MGRSKLEIDHNAVLTLRAEGRTISETSEAVNVSTATLPRRLSYLRHNEGTLTKYRELQHLRVSDLSAKVLDSLEDELPELNPDQKIKLFGMLQRANEKYEEKEDNKITGLLGLLTTIDEEEKNQKAFLKIPPGPRI